MQQQISNSFNVTLFALRWWIAVTPTWPRWAPPSSSSWRSWVSPIPTGWSGSQRWARCPGSSPEQRTRSKVLIGNVWSIWPAVLVAFFNPFSISFAAMVKRGYKNLLLVPIAFVNDHIETLHELDIEYAQDVGKEVGAERIARYVPTYLSSQDCSGNMLFHGDTDISYFMMQMCRSQWSSGFHRGPLWSCADSPGEGSEDQSATSHEVSNVYKSTVRQIKVLAGQGHRNQHLKKHLSCFHRFIDLEREILPSDRASTEMSSLIFKSSHFHSDPVYIYLTLHYIIT